jgi:exodeoxyribonuclease V alpha subunit
MAFSSRAVVVASSARSSSFVAARNNKGRRRRGESEVGGVSFNDAALTAPFLSRGSSSGGVSIVSHKATTMMKRTMVAAMHHSQRRSGGRGRLSGIGTFTTSIVARSSSSARSICTSSSSSLFGGNEDDEAVKRASRSGDASTSFSSREYYGHHARTKNRIVAKAINHPDSKPSSSASASSPSAPLWHAKGYATSADYVEEDGKSEMEKQQAAARKTRTPLPPRQPSIAASVAAQRQPPQQKNDFSFTGEVHRVTFHAADTGYTVARVLCSDEDTLKQLPKGALTKPNRRPKKGQKEPPATITVVGEMPNVGVGQTLKLSGYWRSNPKFGVEFVSTKPAEMCVPSDEQGVIAYLSSGILPGCGPATAEKIVSHFGGKETLAALDSADGAKLLTKVPGIGAKTAVKLKNSWDESSTKRKATSFLTEELGASALIARRASLKHGAQTEVRVRADPFKALSDIRGCSFHHIDEIAARLKKSPDDPSRLGAAMRFALQRVAQSGGHAYMTWPALKDHTRKLLGNSGALIPDDVFIEAAKIARNSGDIFVFQNFSEGEFGARTPIASLAQWNDDTHVFHGSLHECEKSIADDLLRRLSRPKFKVDEARVAKWLELTAEKENWGPPGLSRKQFEFLNVALTSPCVALTGGPGTGKTFATHVIVRLMRAMGKTVVMCAPTGRAAQRMAEMGNANRTMSNPLQSSTIHRLLEFKDFSSQGDSDKDSSGAGDDASNVAVDDSNALSFKGVFARNRANPLDCDVVVVDEASMLDAPLCAALLDAIPPKAQLIIVGDADQLPSVGPGAVLRDVIASQRCPHVHLAEVFRQAEKSKIVGAAHAINRGDFPDDIVRATWTGSQLIASDDPSIDLGDASITDCVWVDTTEKEDDATVREILSFIIDDILPRRRIAAKEKLQVLSPMRKGNNSAATLNAFLREKLNAAEGSDSGEFSSTDDESDFLFDDADILKLRTGDRVLQKRNDYTKEVFNGDLGVVTSIDSNVTTVTFNTKSIQYTKSEVLANLLPAWAMTVHKSQGCEYSAVVLCLSSAHGLMLRRNLLYTGVSRAKDLLVILAPRRAMERAVQDAQSAERNTGLEKKLNANYDTAAPSSSSSSSTPKKKLTKREAR